MLDPQATPGGIDLAPHCTDPKTVAIVGLSFSAEIYIRESMSSARLKSPYDEVWTLNRGIKAFPHDKLFCMDDLRYLAHKDPAYGEVLKAWPSPIITSTPYPEFPASTPYPYNEVVQTIQDDVFNVNTVSYMVAYAIHIGVRHLYLYGCDFVHPNGNHAEHGGQAVTYLLGLGKAKFGLEYYIPGNSTLLYANRVKQVRPGVQARDPYGYHRRDQLPEELKGINPLQPPAAKGGADIAGEQLRRRTDNLPGPIPAPDRRAMAQELMVSSCPAPAPMDDEEAA